MTLTPHQVEALRQQFPALNRPVDKNGTLPVHFDNPAGTQVPQAVIEAVREYYLTMNANKGGPFPTSQRNDAMMQQARQTVADFINAPAAKEIVFGPNMTSLCFQLSRAIGKTLQPGDEIVLTVMDHDANITPWTLIAEDHNLTVRWVDIHTEDCTLDMDTLEGALSDRTRIVATVHAANSVGTINPIKRIAEMAHAAGAWYVVDAVQSAPHIPIDVQDIGCDFLLCSAYKFFGPHIGVMWGHYEYLQDLPVYQVRPAPQEAPYRWETGTLSFETIAGTMAALNYLADIGEQYGGEQTSNFPGFSGKRLHFKTGMSTLAAYERTLTAHLIERLKSIPGLSIAGITQEDRFKERVPTVTFTMPNYTPQEIAEHLAARHIYLWAGHYYALKMMERLDKQPGGMVRVGMAHYNTIAEIDRLYHALQQLIA